MTFFEDISYYSSKGRQLQESMFSAPVIPTHVPIAPPTSPISIVPLVPPISQVYVRRRNQDVPLDPPPPPVEFSLPLPPSASTYEDSSPPQSTSNLDLPIVIHKVSALALSILSLTVFPLIICLLLLKHFLYHYHHLLFLSPTGSPFSP